MIGVLEANLYFWIGFTIFHITVCFVLTAQVYYFGLWKLGNPTFKRSHKTFL